ncbi:MAG: hypothetical protein JW993_03925 [Sedimentisphaerales bacterium]|nr:hypothetical protein [Sedimentisphaerales bacterium]
MTRKTVIPMMVVGAAILLGTSAAQADVHAGFGVTISPRVGLGVWVGAPARRPVVVEPHRHGSIIGLWRRGFGRFGPPRHAPVIVPSPVRKPVVIASPPAPPVEVASITVWITNSNGSRTSVKLTKRGPWYVGPRGEYYTCMPTNEQLRLAYGF